MSPEFQEAEIRDGGVGRKGNRKGKEDEGWIGFYLGALAHILPQFFPSFIFGDSNSVPLTLTSPCPWRSGGSDEVLDVVSLLVPLLPVRKECQATEHSDSQNQTHVVRAGELKVRGKELAETNCHLPPFFPGVSPGGT